MLTNDDYDGGSVSTVSACHLRRSARMRALMHGITVIGTAIRRGDTPPRRRARDVMKGDVVTFHTHGEVRLVKSVHTRHEKSVIHNILWQLQTMYSTV